MSDSDSSNYERINEIFPEIDPLNSDTSIILTKKDTKKNTNKDILSVKEALNEYFKLKSKFEDTVYSNKKKIINNPTLSKREKRSEFLKLKPKCINCKRPSKKGTIFSIIYNPENENSSAYRKFSASCGDLADPCNLDIEIHLGDTEPLDKLMNNIREEIKMHKNKIIDDKNKLLFGLITTEKALEKFDFNKTYITDLTSVYEMYLDEWNKLVENPDKKLELDDALVLSYENINKIKECIKKMNENDDNQYAMDAANIYVTTLKPLLDKIRHLKYSENIVYHDEYNNNCKLIQRKYTDLDIGVSGFNSKVVKYDVGLQAKVARKKKSGLIISDSDDEIEVKPSENKELIIKIQEPGEPKPIDEIPPDEPIIGQGVDGIDWHLEEYKKLWSKLPPKLKTEFKLNIDWMKDFMYKCLNAPKKEGVKYNGCKLPTPPNIIIPPKQMPNGQYDFGVSIYNTVFNKLAKSSQQTYLTFYKEDPATKVKNYNMLIDSMNRLVEQELDFGRGFF
jgi:hypothetical protein